MRLEFLLVSDKVGYSPEITLMIEDGVIHAISKYMEIKKDKAQIQMDTEGSPQKDGYRTLPVFHANIPIRSMSNEGPY